MSRPAPFCGILCVDKPRGWTSTQVVVRTRRAFGSRAGHTGTLDPAATGLLVLAVGRATRLIPFLGTARKRYRAVVCLGTATDTLDSEGRAVETRPVPSLDRERVQQILRSFEGEIEQVPPMFSALHHRGQRLYRLARRGLQVPREPRRVIVESIGLLSLGTERLEIDIVCGPGTYIRSLAADIAQRLGTAGHLLSLRRMESDGFSVEQAVDIGDTGDEELQRALVPLESVLNRFARLDLSEELIRLLLDGNVVPVGPEDLPRVAPELLPGRLLWVPAPGVHLLARSQATEENKLLLQPVRIIRLE